MSDPVSAARAARENLARALGALQSPGVPPQLMSVAEPVAHAMSALHRIEASHGEAQMQFITYGTAATPRRNICSRGSLFPSRRI